MADQLRFYTDKDLIPWLSNKPPNWAQVLASRAALRVLPIALSEWANLDSHDGQIRDGQLLNVIRANLIPWAFGLRLIDDLDAAVRTADAADATDFTAAVAANSTVFTADSTVFTADAINSTTTATHAADAAIYATYATFSTTYAAAAVGAARAANARRTAPGGTLDILSYDVQWLNRVQFENHGSACLRSENMSAIPFS
jgi:hypothetical protein